MARKVPALGGINRSYIGRIVASRPLTYFPLNETSGLTARNFGTLGSPANATYSGVDLAIFPSPDGWMAPFFDPFNNAHVELYSDALRDNFDPTTGSLMIWVMPAFLWDDGAERYASVLGVDGSTNIGLYKDIPIGRFDMIYMTGGVGHMVVELGLNYANWQCLTLTWNFGTGEIIGYRGGIPIDNVAFPGVWAGDLHPNFCAIGMRGLLLASYWHGACCHHAVWNRVLSPVEVLDYANP